MSAPARLREALSASSEPATFGAYQWHEAVRASLLPLIGLVEVTLRNAVHHVLSQQVERIPSAAWYDSTHPRAIPLTGAPRRLANRSGRLEDVRPLGCAGAQSSQATQDLSRLAGPLPSALEMALLGPFNRQAAPSHLTRRGHDVITARDDSSGDNLERYQPSAYCTLDEHVLAGSFLPTDHHQSALSLPAAALHIPPTECGRARPSLSANRRSLDDSIARQDQQLSERNTETNRSSGLTTVTAPGRGPHRPKKRKTARRRFSLEASARQTEKLDPQPQVVVAFGFLMTN